MSYFVASGGAVRSQKSETMKLAMSLKPLMMFSIHVQSLFLAGTEKLHLYLEYG